MELLDVVDENNNLIGIKEDKSIIHEKGLLHREIAVIIQNENGEYLVQKRSSNKKGAPKYVEFHYRTCRITEKIMKLQQ